MSNDLYKFRVHRDCVGRADQGVGPGCWGTFSWYVTERGMQMRSVVEHTWPDGLQRPRYLFPELYTPAGMTYVCPHARARALPEAHAVEPSVEGPICLAAESRQIADQLVGELAERRTHFAYLEVDYVDGALDVVRGLPMTPGTVQLFCSEPGLPGTSIELRVEPLGNRRSDDFSSELPARLNMP